MLDPAAGPSRAHRLRLFRAGDDSFRARELQGFRFRAAARPGAACSYAFLGREAVEECADAFPGGLGPTTKHGVDITHPKAGAEKT
jgi:hypothetical protein